MYACSYLPPPLSPFDTLRHRALPNNYYHCTALLHIGRSISTANENSSFVASASLVWIGFSTAPDCHAIRYDKKGKVKVAHTRLPSVGFRSWSRFLAVSLQVMWVINPAVDCHYFPLGLQLPPQPLRGLLPILLLGEEARWVRTVCLRLLPDRVGTAIWTWALLRLSPAR